MGDCLNTFYKTPVFLIGKIHGNHSPAAVHSPPDISLVSAVAGYPVVSQIPDQLSLHGQFPDHMAVRVRTQKGLPAGYKYRMYELKQPFSEIPYIISVGIHQNDGVVSVPGCQV